MNHVASMCRASLISRKTVFQICLVVVDMGTVQLRMILSKSRTQIQGLISMKTLVSNLVWVLALEVGAAFVDV